MGWRVGGKTRLLPTINNLLPSEFNKYYEPFVGGGALYFSECFSNAFISDTNKNLINFYLNIKYNVDEVIEYLDNSKLKNTEKCYYKIRNEYNANQLNRNNCIINAAIFYYLNRTCFNGMYRVNKSGLFNVPYGRYKNYKVNYEGLREGNKVLSDTSIKYCNYNINIPSKNDFVYIDPPYHSTYDGYTSEHFNHSELSKWINKLDKQGIKFLLSNTDNEYIRNLYKNFDIIRTVQTNNINPNKLDKKRRELLIRNYN